MKIIDIRAATVTVPVEAAFRHANGCHWGRIRQNYRRSRDRAHCEPHNADPRRDSAGGRGIRAMTVAAPDSQKALLGPPNQLILFRL